MKQYDAKDQKKREMKFQNSKLFQIALLSCDLFSSFGNKKIRCEKSGKIRKNIKKKIE